MKILSIDGGGVRGIIPARILQEIEDRTGRHSAELFDAISGTSTGGMITLALAKADKEGDPALSAKDVLDIYLHRSKEIFAGQTVCWKMQTGCGLWGSKYNRSNFDKMLEEVFGKALLSQTVCPVFVPIYSLENYKPFISGTFFAKSNKVNDFYLKDIAGATSAALTLFPPKVFKSPNDSVTYKGVDGGIYANNPSLIGISGAYLMQPSLALDSIELVSLGTGELKRGTEKEENGAKKSIDIEDIVEDVMDNDGVIGWLQGRDIIGSMMDADSVIAEAAMKAMLKQGNHFRFQVDLPDSLKNMDDCSDQTISGLLTLAENFIAENTHAIDELCTKLLG
ncbi:hypothetical protein phytr_6470 [Candidatus Phycorickettsia trachydisci]|uniref:PNPLA domain-containing protein n=1 Tax=Candidatus Phycorickettsia trachydisci TaxID=2115978 RepID=A0A2P1P8I7_9RICK|nr:patatin-like phospholipase family protein [Candidatus Phycorickettsia trachydisci]AVP87588.1 hypothetical protein phytr_6470 [Candidatus Phycorickettsia trachydisci]